MSATHPGWAGRIRSRFRFSTESDHSNLTRLSPATITISSAIGSVGRANRHVLDIRYHCPLAHINGSDNCTVYAVGINFSIRRGASRHQGRAKTNHLPGGTPTRPRPTREPTPTPQLPYDIVEMILAYLTHDLRTLKACSLICHSWYPAAAQHLHHTLTFRRGGRGINRTQLEPLSKLHELGLLPLVKEIRVDQGPGLSCWFVPRAFNHHLSTLTNVHTLKIENMEIHRFIPGVKRYFGHLSPTLRSIALYDPCCTPQQLSHFLSHFPNLEDIEIRFAYVHTYNPPIPNNGLVPYSAPKLRGRLVLCGFSWVEALTHLIEICGGLRFRHVDLGGGPCCAPLLLRACAETLETLRVDAREGSLSKYFCISPSADSGS